ncbi:MAG: MerR family transcriptional regulator [Synechococcaceae cyanobacterium]|nr:MerR family transcriptional regulator [Synechococcaceae cyanobacterium]
MSPPNCENVAEIARETRIELARGSNHPIGRSVGGYRLFGEEVFAELTQIRILMAMQIPLQDVRRILETRRSGVCTCTSLQDMIRIMAGEIEKRIAALHDLQSERAALFSRWQVCASRKSSTA